NEKLLLETLGKISAFGGTPTAATLAALAPAIEGVPGKTYVVLATDGGANCDLSATCAVDSCTYNMESQQNCPSGGTPNCCDPAEGGDVRGCLDAQPTLDAVTELAKAGVPVYVVGLVGSGTYASLLDQLAVAGGTSRGTEPLYYDVTTTDQASLLATMSKIAAQITGTCTLTLDQVPPDASLINVFLDGQVLPQSGANGWTLVGDVVTILGSSCQQIIDGDVLDVRVVAGCPTVEL
ncbi:MAG: vWA domain-containing protein, partial [Polyangiaceae bacterium]